MFLAIKKMNLLDGIKNGFDIVDSEKITTPVDIANYTSALKK